MEKNCYHSGNPDGTNWATNNDYSFQVPWQHQHQHQLPQHQFHDQFLSWFEDIPEEDRATTTVSSSSKSHSLAEKRRRDRINSQLSTLRKLIPKSDKMDKAALLGSVIEHVKELKLKAMEVSKTSTIPTEIDEVTVDCEKSDGNVIIKASVCCEDQPELFKELIRVLKDLGLTTVGADIASVGGRVKSILVLCNEDSGGGGQGNIVSLSTLKQSLHLVLSRMSSSSSMASNYRIRSKRQRLFLPSSHFSE